MAANFVRASNQHLTITRTLSLPIVIGAWVWFDSFDDANTIWLEYDGGADFRQVYGYTGGQIWLADIGSASQSIFLDSMPTGAWIFVLARYISQTNRRLSVLRETGEVSHASGTTDVGTISVEIEYLGGDTAAAGFNGKIAEFWVANTDVQIGGLQIDDTLVRQLAYGGPFSVPHIIDGIIEYRSFRKHPTAGEICEVYWGKYGVQNWTNTNGVTIGSHPSLPYWYVKPPQLGILNQWRKSMPFPVPEDTTEGITIPLHYFTRKIIPIAY